MFSKDYEFRYSDLDRNGKIRVSSVIDLLQDVTISHSNYADLSADKMQKMGYACLLDGWRIKFIEPLDPKEKITAKTGLMDVTKIGSLRKYEIWQSGMLKVIASAVWIVVDISKMRIVRVPDIFKTSFDCINEEDNGLPFSRMKPQTDMTELCKTTVELRDLDTNNHMNNVKSAEVGLNRLPSDFSVGEFQIQYRKELTEGEEITVTGKTDGDELYFELLNRAKDVCVMMRVKAQ